MGVAVVDGKIHAIAGRMDSYDFNTSLNAVYDPKTDGWSFRAPLPTARSGPSCVYIGGKIVVFGGEATGKVFGTNEAYDPKTDSWEALMPMAIPRHGLHGATCAVIGNMVHVPGTGPPPGTCPMLPITAQVAPCSPWRGIAIGMSASQLSVLGS